MNRYKRKIKILDSKVRTKLSLYSLSMIIFIFSLSIFILGQIIINNQLSPLGIELQALNNEKNTLIEENRSYEQSLAGIKSLTALEHATQKNTQLQKINSKQIIYLQDTSTQASR